ncbi:hypothetical protein MKZ38_005228 [Zalerion maritima]|uniref:Uncharacterized protein n=1 Tax=Zalerion maritima TaxID=339359 RepID=A0AAD5RLG4_9PEZI|nr:hypothetical protein MKZ38_005228 [Zalerion maritima]
MSTSVLGLCYIFACLGPSASHLHPVPSLASSRTPPDLPPIPPISEKDKGAPDEAWWQTSEITAGKPKMPTIPSCKRRSPVHSLIPPTHALLVFNRLDIYSQHPTALDGTLHPEPDPALDGVTALHPAVPAHVDDSYNGSYEDTSTPFPPLRTIINDLLTSNKTFFFPIPFVISIAPMATVDLNLRRRCRRRDNVRTGTRGFTVGEMAVQCIFAEATVGACSADETDSLSYNEALLMCNGQVSAAPRTHTAINATVVVPESGTGSIVIQTPTATTTASIRTSRTSVRSSYTTMSTVLSTGTPASSTTSRTTTRSTLPISRSSSTTAAATTSPASEGPEAGTGAEGDSKEGDHDESLSMGAIIGIISGSAGFVLLMILGMVFCCRKRRNNIINSSRKSIFTLRGLRRHSTDSDIGFGPPMSKTGSPSTGQSLRPNMFPRMSIDPGAIGLAIVPNGRQQLESPPRTVVAKQKTHPFPLHPQAHNQTVSTDAPALASALSSTAPNSAAGPVATVATVATAASTSSPQLQAPKPVLTLTIPTTESTTDRHESGPPVPPKRQTTQSSLLITPFEEDGYEDSPEPTSTTQIWRPPASAGPHSASVYYVADKNGNWVLGDPSTPTRKSQFIELESPSPMTKSPMEKQEEERARRKAMASRNRGQGQGYWNVRSSSIYSQDPIDFGGSARASTRESKPTQKPFYQPHHPSSSQRRPPQGQQAQQQQPKGSSWTSKLNPLQPQRRGPAPTGNQRDRSHSRSSDSVTTIDDSDGEQGHPSQQQAQSGSNRPRQSAQQGLQLQTETPRKQSQHLSQHPLSAGLSPVAESPGSSSRKSPVAYPRIPRPTAVGFAGFGRRPSQTIRQVPNEEGNGRTTSDQLPSQHQTRGDVRKPPRTLDTFNYKPPGQPSPTLGNVGLVINSEADIIDAYGAADADEGVYPKPLSPYKGYSANWQGQPRPYTSSAVYDRGAGQSNIPPRSLTDKHRRQHPRSKAPDSATSGHVRGLSNTISSNGRPFSPQQNQEKGSVGASTSLPWAQNSNAINQLRQAQSLTHGWRLDLSSPTQAAPPVYKGPRTSNAGTMTTPTNSTSDDPFTFTSPGTTNTRTSTPATAPLGNSGPGTLASGSFRRQQDSYEQEQAQQHDGQHGHTHIAHMQSPTSATTTNTMNSVASSLLAKRLGNDRAAQMALQQDERNGGGKWNRAAALNSNNGLLSPFSASGGRGANRDGVQGQMSGRRGNGAGRDQMPMSPLWIPKLTPTRRGEDLVLNVQ